MRTKKTPFIIALTSLFLLTGFFCSTSMAETSPAAHVSGADSKMPFHGTDSKGSYSYESEKKEGSKSKSYSKGTHGLTQKKGEGSGSKAYTKKGHGKVHGKKEGSGSKKYSASKHGYTYKKEGSGSHKARHGYSSGGHGYSKHKGFHGKNPFKHVLRFKKKLGLTEKQVEQIKTLEFEYKKFKVQSNADHAIAHMELDRLVHAETLDESKIRSLADRISEIKSASIHTTIEAKIGVLKILTPEQKRKVNKMHSSH